MASDLHLSETDLSLLGEVVTSFHTVRDLDDMFMEIITKLRPLFNIEGASIALHDSTRREFYFYRMIEELDDDGKLESASFTFPDDKGIANWVMEHDQSVLINDVTDDERVYTTDELSSDFVTRSMVCVPLKTRRSFIGVFYALNKISGEFNERDRKLLEILSGTIAASLENARLYGDLKDHLHALELEKRKLISQARSEAGFKEIIGTSRPMRNLFELMEKVIVTPTTVLIQGETGTGKELIAKVIHYNGPLGDKAFIAENCAALPESLLESELFGHVKGSFTGAVADKKGLFEIADGGTIFLDEIGEMSLQMQVKLLRVLQEGQFRPVGGSRTVQVKVRLIASTNRNLAEEVEQGNFREDLYYRINVFQITPPPLRQRKDDILLLCSHFLEKLARKYAKPTPHLTPQTLDILTHYDWPGNVRELENEMERAITMAAGLETISADMLSDRIRSAHPGYRDDRFNSQPGSLKEAVSQLEQKLIRQALEETGGNRSQAAKALGLSRQGLLNKISAYKI
jgi:Nif-specific regulatory protein